MFPISSFRIGRTRLAVAAPTAIAAACSLWATPTAAAQVTLQWVQPTRGIGVAADSNNAVVSADFEMQLGSEITVTKRDADGSLLWTASIDQTDPTKWEAATWVCVDPQDNVIVSGTLKSGFSNPVNAASILLKFSPDGQPLWRIVYESSFDGSSTQRCVVDNNANIYVLGLGFGPDGLVSKVKKFAPDGTTVWNYFNTDGIGRPVIIKRTPDGSLLIVGRSLFGSLNGYAKLSTDGQPIWGLAGLNSQTVGDAAGDATGNTYIVYGDFKTGLGVLRKLDPAGDTLWETPLPHSAFRVDVGPDGLPITSGFPNSGTPGAAFSKFDADGNELWRNLDADGPLALLLHAQMLIDDAGSAYLAAGTLFDMAVCKVDALGNSAWTLTAPGSFAQAMALGTDLQRSVFVVGGNTARFVQQTCPGLIADLDASGIVDSNDLGILLSSFGIGVGGDVNGDEITDAIDLGILLASFGQACPG